MNLNKAIIIGRVTQDPESRTTPQGQTVANFSIATNRNWTDQSGQKQEKVEFHNIVAWRKLAEICGQYLKKGQLVMIEGRIETRSWEDKDGVKKYRTEIVAENMQMGPKAGSSQAPQDAPTGASTKQEEPEEELPVVDADDGGGEKKQEIDPKDIPF